MASARIQLLVSLAHVQQATSALAARTCTTLASLILARFVIPFLFNRNCVCLIHRLCVPCFVQNGGVCSNSPSGFTCACSTGFLGACCETTIDSCASSPCANGGICSNSATGFACACPTGYSGTRCENLFNSCASSPCQVRLLVSRHCHPHLFGIVQCPDLIFMYRTAASAATHLLASPARVPPVSTVLAVRPCLPLARPTLA